MLRHIAFFSNSLKPFFPDRGTEPLIINPPACSLGSKSTKDIFFLVKNIFRRIVPREDLEKYVTFFERIPVDQGLKPSDVANILFDDPFLDWVILLTNNITDIYEQWPKTEDELLRYINTRYSNPDDVHHYETREALYNGVVFVKEGITVNSTWRTVLPDGTTLGENDSIYAVSNYEHETYLNELKRFILVPTPRIIDKFVDDTSIGIGLTDIKSTTGTAHTIHTDIDHGLNRIIKLSIIINKLFKIKFLWKILNE